MERRVTSHTEEEEMNQRRHLLALARKGDESAVTKLMELYQVKVYSGNSLKSIKIRKLPPPPPTLKHKEGLPTAKKPAPRPLPPIVQTSESHPSQPSKGSKKVSTKKIQEKKPTTKSGPSSTKTKKAASGPFPSKSKAKPKAKPKLQTSLKPKPKAQMKKPVKSGTKASKATSKTKSKVKSKTVSSPRVKAKPSQKSTAKLTSKAKPKPKAKAIAKHK